MERDNRNSGALFARQKKSPNSPDVGGDIELGQDLIEYLNDCLSKGKPAKLGIVGWAKLSRDRKSFTSLKVEVPYSERENAQTGQPRGYPNRGAYQGNRQGMPDRVVQPDYPQRMRQDRADYGQRQDGRQTTQGGLPYYGNSPDDDDPMPF